MFAMTTYVPLSEQVRLAGIVHQKLRTTEERDAFTAARAYFLELRKATNLSSEDGLVLLVGTVPGHGPSAVYAWSNGTADAPHNIVNEVLAVAHFHGPVFVGHLKRLTYEGAIENLPSYVRPRGGNTTKIRAVPSPV